MVIEGDETILHLIPSGIFNDVDCIIANGVVLHLPTLFDEITLLQQKGANIEHKLHISKLCPLIFPSHIALDNAKEKILGSKALGTTGRGIGPAYEDKVARRAIHLSDIISHRTISREASWFDGLSQLLAGKLLQYKIFGYSGCR